MLRVSKLSEIQSVPATVHRRHRSVEYSMAKIQSNLDVQGRSPSYTRPKMDVKQPRAPKRFNNHARGSIIREPEAAVIDQESEYSDFDDPRDDEYSLSGMLAVTGTILMHYTDMKFILDCV